MAAQEPMLDDLAPSDDDLAALRAVKFPGFIEVAGLVAGGLPFALSMSELHEQYENGRRVAVSFRDWVAVGGGAAAALAGLVGLALLGRTVKSRRTPRLVLALILVGLGGFQLARGLGLVGVPAARSAQPTAPERVLPPPAAERTVAPPGAADAAQQVLDRMLARKHEELRAAASADFRAAGSIHRVRQHVGDRLDTFGAFQHGTPWRLTATDRSDAGEVSYELSSQLTFARVAITMKISVVERAGSWQLLLLDFTDIPDAFAPLPADGEAGADVVARAVLAAIDRGDLDQIQAHLDWKAADEMDDKRAALTASLAEVTAKTGAFHKVELTKQEACVGQCLQYAITGKRGRATAELELAVSVGRWRVRRFDVTPR